MTFRRLAPILWIALYLVALELALEYRAARRGWEALLLGKPAGWAHAGDASFGPSEDFPFRSRRIQPARTPRTARVWFASASYGEDLQLPPEEVFPNRTGELLHELGIACEVLNASHSGDSILSNVEDLAIDGERYRPDAVVLYEMSNDVDRLAVELCSGGFRPEAAPAGDAAVTEATTPGWGGKVLEETTVFKHLKSEVTSRLSKGRALASTLGEEGERRFAQRVEAFLEECRAIGATPVLCTFATAYRAEDARRVPEEFELNLLRFNVYLSTTGWLDSVERFNAVIRRVAGEKGVEVVDLAGELSGRRELFRDMWHLKEPGHRIAATAVSRVLAKLPVIARAAE
jgi:hypothetical protein